MSLPSLRTSCRCLFLILAFLFSLIPTPSHAYTPESPEVRKVIDKGIRFLEKTTDDRLGGKCVVAMAIMKATGNKDHPRVHQAVRACKANVRNQISDKNDEYIYSTSLAAIFLSELDAKKYKKEIEFHIGQIYAHQKGHGGWGYAKNDTGDTSQTQYALLACWEAHHVGIGIKGEAVQRGLNWLLRTQDPSGAWGYQGQDSGGKNRVRQELVTISMCAAGAGGTLMASDMLKIYNSDIGKEEGKPKEKDPADDFPPAITEVGATDGPAETVKGKVPVDEVRVNKALDEAKKWMDKHFIIKNPSWQYYYLYSLERYKSFQEILDGEPNSEPDWYNKGFEHLRDSQAEDGQWASGGGEAVDTAFSVLFLIRSMRMSLDDGLGSGTLVPWDGLPSDVTNLKVRKGRLILKKAKAEASALAKILEDPDNPDYKRIIGEAGTLEISISKAKPEDVSRLKRVIRGGEPIPRWIAVRTLAKRRNLDDVPAFLFALSDPDKRVALAARDSLRFISRRMDGFGLKDDFKPKSAACFDAIEKWKEWYHSIRPGASTDF